MKSYESFSEWKADQSEDNQKTIDELQKLISKTAPHLTTTVKWEQGCWIDQDSPRLYIHAEPDHVQLGFYNGASLDDPEKLLSGNGKFVRFIKVHDSSDIRPESFSKLIAQSIL